MAEISSPPKKLATPDKLRVNLEPENGAARGGIGHGAEYCDRRIITPLVSNL